MSIKESALAAITSITSSDFIRAVTSAGASRRITLANLANFILRSYAPSTSSPTSGSVQDQINSLNSKTNFVITGSGGYYSEATITAVRNYFDNNAAVGISIGVISSGDYGGAIIIKANANIGIVFRLSYTNAASKGTIKSMTKINTWGDWIDVV